MSIPVNPGTSTVTSAMSSPHGRYGDMGRRLLRAESPPSQNSAKACDARPRDRVHGAEVSVGHPAAEPAGDGEKNGKPGEAADADAAQQPRRTGPATGDIGH